MAVVLRDKHCTTRSSRLFKLGLLTNDCKYLPFHIEMLEFSRWKIGLERPASTSPELGDQELGLRDCTVDGDTVTQ